MCKQAVLCVTSLAWPWQPTNQMTHKQNRRKSRRGNGKKFESGIERIMVAARNPVRIHRTILSFQSIVATNGSGEFTGSLGMDPSGANEWASYALLYDQFRVVGGQLKLACCIPNNSSALNTIVRFAFDNDSNTPPTSYGSVMQFSEVTDVPAIWATGIKTVNFRRPVIKGIPQSENALWINEATPSVSLGGLKLYGSGATPSTTYWSFILDYVVEFQMRS